VIRIKFSKRLLATAVVGAVLVISTALIVSLRGDEKPTVTTNPPAADNEPTVSPVTPVATTDTPPSTDQIVPTEPEEPTNERPGHGNHNGNGNGNGNTGDNDDSSTANDGKARGLARALEVHLRNKEKMTMKGKTVPQGLADSTAQLQIMLDMHVGNDLAGQHDDNGQHKGQQQGHHGGT